MALFGLENWTGLWAFLSLVPFILIYLIKPKPKELDVPSLMFFTRSIFSDKERSFLRRFTGDWVFFLQLLILLLLSAFFISPYINLKEGVLLDSVVIVLDTSASMQVGDRFDTAVGKAKDLLGGANTIILVSNSPRIGVKDADEDSALQFLKGLKATDVRSDIGDAIVLAGEQAKGENPVVFVISDFIGTEGVGVDVAVNALKGRGITVNLIDVNDGKKLENFGIVDVNAEEETTQVLVKNFNDKKGTIKLGVNDLKKDIGISPNSVEPFSFKTPGGITEIEILDNDDFIADNKAYVSKPIDTKIKVLLISNDPSIYLQAALEASKDVSVEVSKPPVIPPVGYDVYVINNVDKKLVITGIFEKIKEEAEKGSGVVVYAQDDSDKIDYKGLLGFSFGEKVRYGALAVEQVNRFTREVEFGNVNAYFRTKNNKMSSIVSTDNSTVVALQKLKSGRAVYYGILESESDFKLSPSYPVFWTNLVKLLADVGEVQDLNLDTGTILTFENKMQIKTPSRNLNNDVLTLDEIGVYEIGNKVYAANLNSEAESDVNGLLKSKEFREKLKELKGEEKIKGDLSMIAIIIVLILLLIETVAVKLRGDI